ncbi:hypothetical protein V2J09_005076 [Rumex salicifolius]
MEGSAEKEEFVYRISTVEEWDELQKNGCVFGGDLDKSTGCFHLSNLDQVQPTLQRFFMNIEADLYLLQIDSNKLGDGLIYELAEDNIWFPHFYGPSRSFAPLPLTAVVKAEKLHKAEGKFCCSLFN